MNFGKDTEAQ